MGRLESGLEWLRPWILGSRTWDYCVVWKIVGDDHLSNSRSIEWVDCCCVGGTCNASNSTDGRHSALKDARREQQDSAVSVLSNTTTTTTLCRDTKNPHPVRGKACEYLALYPFSTPLHAGVGEAILGSQPTWCTPATISNAETSDARNGTRVLIPVVGGLVELFAAKQILKNQKIIDFVASRFNMESNMEGFLSAKLSTLINLFSDFPNSFQYNQSSVWQPSFTDLLISQFRNHHNPNLEGSSCGSIEQQQPSLNSAASRLATQNNNIPSEENKLLLSHLGSNKRTNISKDDRSDQYAEFSPGSNDHHHQGRSDTVSRRLEKKQCRSKNLVAERKRRHRIRRGLCDLRALVPKISKMNSTATVGDAIDHIGKLKQTVRDLEEKLKEFGEEVDFRNCSGLKHSTAYGGGRKDYHGETAFHVEVNQLTAREFLLRVLSQSKRRHAFTRLIEALDSLDLEVVDANVTACDGTISNLLVVKASKSEIQAAKLRDSLIELAV